ncbi:hypothetical protein DIPPA_21131 [Diplonema papillatum]|nr:hypothetical protein DIPPA_21131 [Diplonema papillatum]|eukprot:gene23310-35690_t
MGLRNSFVAGGSRLSSCARALRRQARMCQGQAQEAAKSPSTGNGLLRVFGISAAGLLVGAFTMVGGGPTLDTYVLPSVYRCALTSLDDSRRRREAQFVPADGTAVPNSLHAHSHGEVDDLTALLSGHDPRIVVLNGPPMSGKSSLLEPLLQKTGRPVFYLNARGIDSSACAFLYGYLGSILAPTGRLGGVVLTYHKIFNCMIDFFTMNAFHTHVTMVLFEQAMHHATSTLRLNKWARKSEGPEFQHPETRPIFVVDGAECLVAMSEAGGEHDLIASAFVQKLVAYAQDEALCDVLFVTDSSALLSQKLKTPAPPSITPFLTGTRLYQSFPDLASRATFTSITRTPGPVVAYNQRDMSSTILSLASEPGAQPALFCQIVQDLQLTGSCDPVAMSQLCSVTTDDACAVAGKLAHAGLVCPAVGVALGPRGGAPGTAARRSSEYRVRCVVPSGTLLPIRVSAFCLEVKLPVLRSLWFPLVRAFFGFQVLCVALLTGDLSLLMPRPAADVREMLQVPGSALRSTKDFENFLSWNAGIRWLGSFAVADTDAAGLPARATHGASVFSLRNGDRIDPLW